MVHSRSLNKEGTRKIKYLKLIVYYMSIVAPNAAAFGVEKKIFCYGDSLTAGTTPGREPHLFPYASPLEQNLKTIDSEMSVMVRWRGLPGWSASEMVNQQDVDGVGLRHALSNKGINLAVILAGTNDLGHVFQSQMDVDRAAGEISKSVTLLHKVAHKEGVQTLAISIPDSGFQSQVPIAKKIAMKANENIEEWCLENCSMCSYLKFPFGWNADDSRWADDGLHFSEKGYFEIARAIAPTIYTIVCS